MSLRHPVPQAAPSSQHPSAEQIQAFQVATRDLIGIAMRSLEQAGEGVSLPQMRLLLALHDLGRSPSSRVARALELRASSVTRLADRLVASGHVARGSDPGSRSVVTLELTAQGNALIEQVLDWRKHELSRVLAHLTPEQRQATCAGLQTLHRVIAADYADADAAVHAGPVPL